LQPSGRATYKLTNWGPLLVDNQVWEICERLAEVQALLDDHIACGKHSAAEVVAKAQAVLSEPGGITLTTSTAN
jgi:hypothetical protein